MDLRRGLYIGLKQRLCGADALLVSVIPLRRANALRGRRMGRSIRPKWMLGMNESRSISRPVMRTLAAAAVALAVAACGSQSGDSSGSSGSSGGGVAESAAVPQAHPQAVQPTAGVAATAS